MEENDLYVIFKVYDVILNSSAVERPAVNRDVVGSNPTWGVKKERKLFLINWLLGQAVKTSPFHGGNTGSIPVGVIRVKAFLLNGYGPLAQLVRATGS